MPSSSVEEALSAADIRSSLCFAFDFELLAEPHPPRGFSVDGCECRVVAVDATGGAYVECRAAQTWYAYVDPRGLAGPVARGFAELVRLVIELPHWREVIAATTSDELAALRDAAAREEQAMREDLPFFEAARADLLASLPLPAMPDPVAYLHEHAVRSDATPRVLAADGAPCEPLLGSRLG